jgi:hypothetical protein
MNENEIIGKTVIVGVSYYDENDVFLDQKQFHGKIVAANQETGIRYVDEQSNEERVLPPFIAALFPAPKGLYREYTTGKSIDDPDFISLWHVRKKAGDNDNWDWQPYRADLRISESESTMPKGTEPDL